MYVRFLSCFLVLLKILAVCYVNTRSSQRKSLLPFSNQTSSTEKYSFLFNKHLSDSLTGNNMQLNRKTRRVLRTFISKQHLWTYLKIQHQYENIAINLFRVCDHLWKISYRTTIEILSVLRKCDAYPSILIFVFRVFHCKHNVLRVYKFFFSFEWCL